MSTNNDIIDNILKDNEKSKSILHNTIILNDNYNSYLYDLSRIDAQHEILENLMTDGIKCIRNDIGNIRGEIISYDDIDKYSHYAIVFTSCLDEKFFTSTPPFIILINKDILLDIFSIEEITSDTDENWLLVTKNPDVTKYDKLINHLSSGIMYRYYAITPRIEFNAQLFGFK